MLLFSHTRAGAEVIITNQHVDLTMQWNGSTWNSYLNVDDFGIVSLQDARIRLPIAAANPRPASSQFDFLGTAPGNTVWSLPQVQNPQLAWLGIATQTTGLVSPVKVSLTAVQGPGNVALWNTDPFGVPEVHWATFDGLTSSDHVNLATNTHGHFNWTFSAAGNYLLTFDVQANQTGGAPTPTGTFQVQFQAVPEPAGLTVLATTAMLSVLYRKRRRLLRRP